MKGKATVSFLSSPDYRLALVIAVFVIVVVVVAVVVVAVVVVEIAHNGRSHCQILCNTKGDGP